VALLSIHSNNRKPRASQEEHDLLAGCASHGREPAIKEFTDCLLTISAIQPIYKEGYYMRKLASILLLLTATLVYPHLMFAEDAHAQEI